MWAPVAAGPYIGAHIQSLMDVPPWQGAYSLGMQKNLAAAHEIMNTPGADN